jgi:hypothetical protein
LTKNGFGVHLTRIFREILWSPWRRRRNNFAGERKKNLPRKSWLARFRRVPLRVARFFLVQRTKTGKNIPNYNKICLVSVK